MGIPTQNRPVATSIKKRTVSKQTMKNVRCNADGAKPHLKPRHEPREARPGEQLS